MIIEPDRTIAPSIHPFPALEMPSLRMLHLDNGIPLYVLDQGDNEVCRISVVRDGGTAESVRPVVATLMAEMLCEGTCGMSGAELTDCLEFNGAWFNGISHRHHTAAVMYALNRTFGDVMPLLLSMATEANFPEERFLALKEKAVSNASVRARQVKSRSLEIIRRMIYGPEHPYSKTDSSADIASVSVDDLRRYYASGLTDKSAAIYLGGRITPAMEDAVNRMFGSFEPTVPIVSVDRRPMSPVADRLETVSVEGAMQGSVRIAIPTIGPSHPDYCDLSLAVTALGGYFGSRLMSNIREDKGYTYGIQAFLIGSGHDGLMVISSEADNVYVEPLIREVLEEIRKMSTVAVESEELDRMRNFVLSQAVASLDSPFNIIGYHESLHYDALPSDTFRQRMEAVRTVSGTRIMEVALKYLDPDSVKIAVAGDVDAFSVDENRIFH